MFSVKVGSFLLVLSLWKLLWAVIAKSGVLMAPPGHCCSNVELVFKEMCTCLGTQKKADCVPFCCVDSEQKGSPIRTSWTTKIRDCALFKINCAQYDMHRASHWHCLQTVKTWVSSSERCRSLQLHGCFIAVPFKEQWCCAFSSIVVSMHLEWGEGSSGFCCSLAVSTVIQFPGVWWDLHGFSMWQSSIWAL